MPDYDHDKALRGNAALITAIQLLLGLAAIFFAGIAGIGVGVGKEGQGTSIGVCIVIAIVLVVFAVLGRFVG